jgi:hypothetical protein
LGNQALVVARPTPPTAVARLARFFPQATRVRLPVRVIRVAGETSAQPQATVIEFGTSHEVLFASALPLEFSETLRLQNSDGSLDAEASVVAVQHHNGRTAVAARFTQDVPNWIVNHDPC